MVFDGKSRPWDTGAQEQGEELRERWGKENGMAAEGVRLMAGRMVGWAGLLSVFWEMCVVVWRRRAGKRRSRTRGNQMMGRKYHFGHKRFGQMMGHRAAQRKTSSRPSRKMN